jgi:AAA family ATP:ADP antiporter
LKNRTKAFVDIFVDRFGRGVAGILLAVMLWAGLRDMRIVAVLTLLFTGSWILLARLAQREYTGIVRSRIERRRLELEDARLTVGDPGTLQLLEQTLESANPRQACYALKVLADAPGYDLAPVLQRISHSPFGELRAQAYRAACVSGSMELLTTAVAEIRGFRPGNTHQAAEPITTAIAYVLSVSPEARERAREFLGHAHLSAVDATVAALRDKPKLASEVITFEWIASAAADGNPRWRKIAAAAIAVLGTEGAADLRRLLTDSDPSVVMAACRSAGGLGDRSALGAMIRKLDNAAVRAVAIESLAAFGPGICGSLGDWLGDPSVSLGIRRQIPRVLKMIRDQRSVDVLLEALGKPELSIRVAVLRALSHLRATAPGLQYGETFVTEQILQEARHYFQLYSALEPFRDHKEKRTASGLLTRSLEERLQQTIERLFHLLGLCYPAEDMHAAYLAVRRQRREQYHAALDFLDTVLERPLKRVVLPLLEGSEAMAKRGRDLFGVEARDAESAIRELIGSPDPWLAACAMSAAAEHNYYRLADAILAAAEHAGAEVTEVARSAVQTLALPAEAD